MTIIARSKQCPLCGGELNDTSRDYQLTHDAGMVMHYGTTAFMGSNEGPQIRVTWRCMNGCEVQASGSRNALDRDDRPKLRPKPKKSKSLIDESNRVEFEGKAAHAKAVLQELSDD